MAGSPDHAEGAPLALPSDDGAGREGDDAARADAASGRRLPAPARGVSAFVRKAWEDNLTGLSGMVAYNFLLSIFPLALLALFIFGRVLQSNDLEQIVLRDLHELFPKAADSTLTATLDGVRGSSTSLGIVALVTSVWIGSSFWGALDTAFCRIYHVPCRTWVEQKRFSFGMLGVVLLLMAATVFVPTVQSILVAGADGLPLGLAEVEGLVFLVTLGLSLVLLFGIFCLIFRSVPNCGVPWRAVWPGALGATVATGLVDYAFPLYLSNISTIAQIGTTFVFVIIVLLWFYALSAIMLGGATVNALRFQAANRDR